MYHGQFRDLSSVQNQIGTSVLPTYGEYFDTQFLVAPSVGNRPDRIEL